MRRRAGHWGVVEPGFSGVERLVRVAYPDADVLEAEPTGPGGGIVSLRLRLRHAPPRMLLRTYSGEPEVCQRELSVIEALPRVVPVPAVCYAACEADPPWVLSSWLDDGPLSAALRLFPADELLMLANDIGALLSAVHRLRFGRSGLLNPDLTVREPLPVWSAEMSARLEGRAATRLGEGIVVALRAFVESHASEMDALFDEAVLCHGSFVPANVIVYASGGTDDRTKVPGWIDWGGGSPGAPVYAGDDRPRVAGIVEWAAAFAGSPLWDIGTFLRYEASLPDGFGEAFADGYRRWDAPLAPDWRRLARRLDLVNLCRLAERGDDRRVARVRSLIEATLLSE